MEDHVLIGIHINNRIEQAMDVQRILTECGDGIRTRLGLHEEKAGNGLIILEMKNGGLRCGELVTKLNSIGGVEAKVMTFSH